MGFLNYIKEINAFYQRQETNPLSSHAANLWHTLMHINNRAGWKTTFTVAVSTICSKSGLADSTFKRARTELRDKGYIDYESRRGNQAAIYKIISLDIKQKSSSEENKPKEVHKDTEETIEKQSSKPKDVDHDHQEQSKSREDSASGDKGQIKHVKHMDDKVVPLLKQKGTKKDPSTAAAAAITLFNENFGKATPYIMTEMAKWAEAVGQSLVIAAMKRALDRGKGTWGYVKGILQDWKNKGLQTIEEAEAEVKTFREQVKQVRRDKPDEIIPDWFYKRDAQQQKPKKETAKEAEERMEVDRLLATYA